MLSRLMSLLGLVLTLCGLSVVTWLLTGMLMAYLRARPPRLTDYKATYLLGRLTPADLGFPYESLKFAVQREGSPEPLLLSAWLVRHPELDARMVVLLHGFADAKVGAAAWLPVLRACRCHVLLLDLAAHGESGGRVATAGLLEQAEVREVIAQMRQTMPEARHGSIVLFGISMGAAVAAAAAEDCAAVGAVIMDSPYSDFRRAAVLHAALFGLPGALFHWPAVWLAQRYFHRDYGSVAPINLIARLRCPVLLIQAGQDVLISTADAALLREQVSAKAQADQISRALVVEEAPHVLALARDPVRYQGALSAFLEALPA